MAISARDEQRALDTDERELVAKTHHPQIQDVDDKEIADIVKRLRERRDRARDTAHRRRREMRGKSAPQGATASRADDGSRLKLEVLSMAMRRTNAEMERRRQMSARTELVANARNALKLKQEDHIEADHPNSRTAHTGMRSVVSEKRKNLIRPMELGRQRQAAKVAQAKRDSRPG